MSRSLKKGPYVDERLMAKVEANQRNGGRDPLKTWARDIDELVVVESRVDGGPIMKRIMPRARGTAYPIKRRYSHIHVTLSDLEPVAEAPEAGGEGE